MIAPTIETFEQVWLAPENSPHEGRKEERQMRTKLIDDVTAAVNALGITVDTVIHQLVTKRGVEVDVRGRARARDGKTWPNQHCSIWICYRRDIGTKLLLLLQQIQRYDLQYDPDSL